MPDSRVPGSDSAPFYSIVVPTFQSERFLARALESVIHQTCSDLEIIVSDGVSADRTIDVARSFAGDCGRLTILSRPDAGPYDAINKAIEVASGTWVLVLGSDDWLATPDVLQRMRSHLETCVEPLVYGNVRIDGSPGWATHGALYDGPFDLAKLVAKNICQQAIFYRRDLFGRIGLFEPRYRVCADWDFALRAWSRMPSLHVDMTVAVFSAGGISTGHNDVHFEADRLGLLAKYLRLRLADRSLIPLRWMIRDLAVKAMARGRWLSAACGYLAFAALAIRARLPHGEALRGLH